MKTLTIPMYLLNDDLLEALIFSAKEVMLELAGEQDTPELPPLIDQLRTELAWRRNTKHDVRRLR